MQGELVFVVKEVESVYFVKQIHIYNAILCHTHTPFAHIFLIQCKFWGQML